MAANNNLRIDLKRKVDKDGAYYYIGRLKGPFEINCVDGVSFIIFTADVGSEELQLSAMENKDNG